MPQEDSEAVQVGPPTAATPLLPSDRAHLSQLRSGSDWIDCHVRTIHGDDTWVWRLRHRIQDFLSSKWGHYFVLALVSIDIACIFATFLMTLHVCEHGSEEGFDEKEFRIAGDVLESISLIISCMFMAELLGSVFAFGPSYFKSAFHCFDAIVIIAAFITDVLLRGPLEEAGSLIVVLRLWRVFKIIEEFSVGANDEMEGLYEHIEKLRDENNKVREESEEISMELEALRRRHQPNGSA